MRLTCLLLVVLLAGSAYAQDAPPKPADNRAAVKRGLAFLAKDALAWKAEHKCVSCHHAALIVWAMRDAKESGHAVDEPVLAELTDWMAKSGSGKTGVPRPEGRPKAFNTKAVYFALALGADREPSADAQAGLKLLLETVKEDQTENGSWVAWPETRAPLFGPSDDTATTLATLALQAAAGDERAKVARDKGVAWLTNTKSDDDPQSIAMRLVLWQRLGRSAEEMQPLVQRITESQNADGGWSQTKEMPSDAWATGQALYALSHAGVKPEDPLITRGREFLVKTQREDGSWLMTSRPCPPSNAGAKNLMPITGGGSAWGVLGLVRSL
jgi:squalene-hopene cyclase-like protein